MARRVTSYKTEPEEKDEDVDVDAARAENQNRLRVHLAAQRPLYSGYLNGFYRAASESAMECK
ncbi:hypothetical protein CVT26_014047 [Gymnopilus dilepis]|uniref:Uncharacterized protein n=1 Tax=Gymnopilus dilepis TaxID=231916 RepID=A0A409VX37_9AGAR|nr:hypothetical protein CVT26_014047 [Gymnopilus dilepis]